jgi:hypothetical protein
VDAKTVAKEESIQIKPASFLCTCVPNILIVLQRGSILSSR